MGSIFEVTMLICFGLSWPISIRKSIVSCSTKGKSIAFEYFVWLGYAFGVLGKLLAPQKSYVLIPYLLNLVMVSIDIALYARNKKLEDCAVSHHEITDAEKGMKS